MVPSKHDAKTLANLRDEQRPVVIETGGIDEAREEISKYLRLGFKLHTFFSDRDGQIGGRGPFVPIYTWVLVIDNHGS